MFRTPWGAPATRDPTRMARQREQVDWYVDLSERLERRESRRKWVILAFFVAVPVLVMGALLLYMVADQKGWIARLRGPRVVAGPDKEKPPKTKEGAGGIVMVKEFQKGTIRFPQLDRDGLLMAVPHSFREEKPEREDAFTVRKESDTRGVIRVYRLFNLGTTDVFEFRDVPVSWVGGEWTIMPAEGWIKIRDDLAAKMKIGLGNPTL